MLNLTADDYGLLENAAGQTDQRIRYSEPLELGARAAVRERIRQIRERMVRIDVPLFDEYPGPDAAYAEFQITEAGRRLLEARKA
jgi:hypothetical protein